MTNKNTFECVQVWTHDHNSHHPMRKWAKWLSELVNGASEQSKAMGSGALWTEQWAVRVKECSERPSEQWAVQVNECSEQPSEQWAVQVKELSERPSGPFKKRLSATRNAPKEIQQFGHFGCTRFWIFHSCCFFLIRFFFSFNINKLPFGKVSRFEVMEPFIVHQGGLSNPCGAR